MFSFSVSSTATAIHPNHITQNSQHLFTMHKKSPHAYKLIPLDVVIILKNFSARILCIFLLSLSCIFRLSQFLFVVLRCTLIQQWQKPMAFVNFLNRAFKVSSKVTPSMTVRGHYLRYQTKFRSV